MAQASAAGSREEHRERSLCFKKISKKSLFFKIQHIVYVKKQNNLLEFKD